MSNEIVKQFTNKLEDYQPIVGKSTIEELKLLADRLVHKNVQNVNSTFVGGGVAEILSRMVPLLNQLGVNAKWDVIKGDDRFFDITKKIHNALHGRKETFSSDDFDYFREVNRKNQDILWPAADYYLIHDPQPVLLIERKNDLGGKWVWRCHIDISQPDRKIWEFLDDFVERYDAAIFSAPNFTQSLSIMQFMVSPSIDPLSDKNKELPSNIIEAVLNRYEIDPQKPLVLQISRFDYLKDPLGVIQAFEMVRKGIDCQLVLAGGTATDDPESDKVLDEVRNRADGNKDIKILLLPPGSDIEINALQRAATVVFQKSIREGFGLTISEALWKSKPVVATAVGGIPLQIHDKLTGLLCHSVDGAAFALKQLLSNREYAEMLGKNGKEHVRQNFLITRHLKEYLLVFTALYHTSDIVYL